MTSQNMLVTILTLTRTNIIIRIGSVFLNAMDSHVIKPFKTPSRPPLIMLVISLDLSDVCDL